MRMKQGRAILGILLAAALLSGCDGANNSSVMETQPPTETRPAATEPKDKVFTVEPNAIEGLVSVEKMIPLKDKYLMVGLNEYDGRAVVLYNADTNTAEKKTLNRLSEIGDFLTIVPNHADQIYILYGDENGSGKYVELYDSTMALLEEWEISEFVKEPLDYATMQVDGAGNHYFLGWNEAGNHEVWIYDKEMQLLGHVGGEMTIGDELIPAADGKMYLIYHVGVKESRFACVDPEALSINDIPAANIPIYHNSTVAGTNGYDFYFNAQEALYGIHAAEGTCDVIIDWASTMFDGKDIRGVFALPNENYLVSNVGGKGMDAGTWKMVLKD